MRDQQFVVSVFKAVKVSCSSIDNICHTYPSNWLTLWSNQWTSMLNSTISYSSYIHFPMVRASTFKKERSSGSFKIFHGGSSTVSRFLSTRNRTSTTTDDDTQQFADEMCWFFHLAMCKISAATLTKFNLTGCWIALPNDHELIVQLLPIITRLRCCRMHNFQCYDTRLSMMNKCEMYGLSMTFNYIL